MPLNHLEYGPLLGERKRDALIRKCEPHHGVNWLAGDIANNIHSAERRPRHMGYAGVVRRQKINITIRPGFEQRGREFHPPQGSLLLKIMDNVASGVVGVLPNGIAVLSSCVRVTANNSVVLE